jgi:hypothetical protein
MAKITTDGCFIAPTALISAAQAFTANWVDLGGEIDVGGMDAFSLCLELDINDSLNMRMRVLTKTPKSTTLEYLPNLKPRSASVNAIADEYDEFDVDADQNKQLFYRFRGCVQTVQVQIQAGTVGASPGRVVTAYYMASR